MDAPPPPRESPQSASEVPAYPAPLPDPVRASAAQEKTNQKEATETTEELVKEEEATAEEAAVPSDPPFAPSSTTNGVAEVGTERLSVTLPPSHVETPLDSPIAQPEELCLPNGLPLPAPQDPEVPAISTAERDDSPIAEPDVSQLPVLENPTPITQAAATPAIQTTPAAADQPAPADQETPTDQETPADPVIQAPPAQPDVPDAVPPVTMDVEEDTPVPQSAAKEEKPFAVETDSIADSASETVPTSPPPTAEERVDTPPPQTVTPTIVETTMQG